ncbi:MAG: cell division protein ZapA [Firmicutes bacterium]|nr:cell division protein ZapA [Bacillota bacterium]
MDSKEKNRVTVSIMGEDYVLRGTSSTDEMDRVGRYVDRLMRKLAESNIQISRHRVAVLAALNLADELLKLKAEQEKAMPFAAIKDEENELA